MFSSGERRNSCDGGLPENFVESADVELESISVVRKLLFIALMAIVHALVSVQVNL